MNECNPGENTSLLDHLNHVKENKGLDYLDSPK